MTKRHDDIEMFCVNDRVDRPTDSDRCAPSTGWRRVNDDALAPAARLDVQEPCRELRKSLNKYGSSQSHAQCDSAATRTGLGVEKRRVRELR